MAKSSIRLSINKNFPKKNRHHFQEPPSFSRTFKALNLHLLNWSTFKDFQGPGYPVGDFSQGYSPQMKILGTSTACVSYCKSQKSNLEISLKPWLQNCYLLSLNSQHIIKVRDGF